MYQERRIWKETLLNVTIEYSVTQPFITECINKSVDYKYNTEQIALFSVKEGGISWQTIGKVVSFDYIKNRLEIIL